MSLPDFGNSEPQGQQADPRKAGPQTGPQTSPGVRFTPEQMAGLRQISVPLKFELGFAVKATVTTDDKATPVKEIVGVIVGYDIQKRQGGTTCKYLVEFLTMRYGGVDVTTVAVHEAAVQPYLCSAETPLAADRPI